jgi:hypothetical protein
MPDNKESLLMLVHGTIPSAGPVRLGANPTWTASDSFFCQGLQQRLGVPIVIKQFSWTGKNSHRARIEAAHRLATWFLQELRTPRYARYYLVAHSHGGNVALYAVKMLPQELRSRVAGIVCLGTPFFHCVPRPANELLVAALFSLLPIVCLQGLLILLRYVGLSTLMNDVSRGSLAFLTNLPSSATHCFINGSLLSVFIAALVGIYSIRLENSKEPFAHHIRSDSDNQLRLFCATAKGDEAYRWLRALQLPFTVSFEMVGAFIGGTLFIVQIASKIANAATTMFDVSFWFAVFLDFLLLGLFGLPIVIGLILTLGTAVALRTTFFSFGESFAVALTQDVQVRVAPPNRNSAVVRRYEYTGSFFTHARLHDDPAVIADVVDWFNGTLQNEPSLFSAYR